MSIKTSVLIITRNRAFILGDCLRALKLQIHPSRHEVIVVDSSEGAETEQLIAEFPWVHYYRIKLPLGTRPQSYTYGAQKAGGEIVALLDDDAIVFPDWLSNLEKNFADDGVGAAGGRVLPREGVPVPSEVPSEISRVHADGRISSNLYAALDHPIEVDVLRGCNMAVRRELLERAGYFDQRLRGQNCRVEDDICLWVKRFGYKVIFDSKAVVRHLAEQRPDIPRSEFNVRSEFYVWRNTVWLYLKHFGLSLRMAFFVGLLTPVRTCFRRVLGGSFKAPRITRDGLLYLPAAIAGVSGGLWGVLMSLCYSVQLTSRLPNSIPKLPQRKERYTRS